MRKTENPVPRSLDDLAERCDVARSSSRDLDGLIFIAVTPGVAEAGRIDQIGGVVGWWPRDAPYQSAREVPAYTRSIDDALLLLPDKSGWNLQGNTSLFYAVVAGNYSNKCANPALAVCAAALRAKAAFAALANADPGSELANGERNA